MGRPLKQTVDYFPHFCNSSKTIPILESRYGNDGYAFWFKLLELLARTEGHYYDCNNLSYWEFLLAKTRVNEETANNILDILANLGKIDKALWKNRVVWCQNLVDNVAEVYKRRQTNLPLRPSYSKQKQEVIAVSVSTNPRRGNVSTNRKRHSRVEESIVKESIVEVVATLDEKGILGIINKLDNWESGGDDLVWLRDFRKDYPDFAIADIKACGDYHSGRTRAKHKGIWKNRFRNWMAKKQEFGKGEVRKARDAPVPKGVRVVR